MITKNELMKKVTKGISGDCWSIGNQTGYSVLTIDGKSKSAHKIFFVAFRGKVPKGKFLATVCHHRWCVNPKHWEPRTSSELVRFNMMDRSKGDQRGRISKWMDAQGVTASDLARASGQSLNAARSWRQGAWPSSGTDRTIREVYPSFPEKPQCEGTHND
jgi:hypothetical protein